MSLEAVACPRRARRAQSPRAASPTISSEGLDDTAASIFLQRLFPPQHVVVVLCKAVGFVADGLEEFEAEIFAAQTNRFAALLDVDEFFFLREADDHGGFALQ